METLESYKGPIKALEHVQRLFRILAVLIDLW